MLVKSAFPALGGCFSPIEAGGARWVHWEPLAPSTHLHTVASLEHLWASHTISTSCWDTPGGIYTSCDSNASCFSTSCKNLVGGLISAIGMVHPASTHATYHSQLRIIIELISVLALDGALLSISEFRGIIPSASRAFTRIPFPRHKLPITSQILH